MIETEFDFKFHGDRREGYISIILSDTNESLFDIDYNTIALSRARDYMRYHYPNTPYKYYTHQPLNFIVQEECIKSQHDPNVDPCEHLVIFQDSTTDYFSATEICQLYLNREMDIPFHYKKFLQN